MLEGLVDGQRDTRTVVPMVGMRASSMGVAVGGASTFGMLWPPRARATFMNRDILPATPQDLEWFCKELVGYAPCVDIKGIVLRSDLGDYDAIVAYDHWVPNSCEMHVWIRDGAGINRTFIREALNYPFSNGRKVIIGRTPAWNHEALHFNRRIGFTEVHRSEGAYGAMPSSYKKTHPEIYVDPENHYSLVFQELRASNVQRWFPPHIIEKQYRGVQWLAEARTEWNTSSSSTKTPASSLGAILKPSFKPWPPKVSEAFWKTKALTSREMAVRAEMERLVAKEKERMQKIMTDSLYGLADKTLSSTIGSPSGIPESKS